MCHTLHPWPHKQREEHHGEGASLWDPVGAAVCSPQPRRKAVVNVYVVLVIAVCGEESGGDAGDTCDVVEERARNLVKALKNVRSPSGKRCVGDTIKFEVESSIIPRVFSADAFDACIHPGALPTPDPWAKI